MEYNLYPSLVIKKLYHCRKIYTLPTLGFNFLPRCRITLWHHHHVNYMHKYNSFWTVSGSLVQRIAITEHATRLSGELSLENYSSFKDVYTPRVNLTLKEDFWYRHGNFYIISSVDVSFRKQLYVWVIYSYI